MVPDEQQNSQYPGRVNQGPGMHSRNSCIIPSSQRVQTYIFVVSKQYCVLKNPKIQYKDNGVRAHMIFLVWSDLISSIQQTNLRNNGSVAKVRRTGDPEPWTLTFHNLRLYLWSSAQLAGASISVPISRTTNTLAHGIQQRPTR